MMILLKENFFFTIEYIFTEPKIEVRWKNGVEQEKLSVNLDDPNEFAYFLKILFLLHEVNSFASKEYASAQISSDK